MNSDTSENFDFNFMCEMIRSINNSTIHSERADKIINIFSYIIKFSEFFQTNPHIAHMIRCRAKIINNSIDNLVADESIDFETGVKLCKLSMEVMSMTDFLIEFEVANDFQGRKDNNNIDLLGAMNDFNYSNSDYSNSDQNNSEILELSDLEISDNELDFDQLNIASSDNESIKNISHSSDEITSLFLPNQINIDNLSIESNQNIISIRGIDMNNGINNINIVDALIVSENCEEHNEKCFEKITDINNNI